MKLKILLLTAFCLIAGSVIRATPAPLALQHDAKAYYYTAIDMVENNKIIRSFLSSSPQFIDHGYPTFLATLMQFVGPDNIFAFQVANYLLWVGSAWLVYRSLRLLGSKRAAYAAVLMLFSPLYLTFSAKIYSEPLASFGTSLLIYGVATMLKRPSLYGKFALTFGGIILFSTKSVLLLFLLPLGIYLLWRREFNYLLWFLLIPIILFPSILGSLGGGRSLYTLNIQSSKLDQSYDQVLACAPYYLSYPLGQLLLPSYQGVCHQNDPSPAMPGYASNPYVLSDIKREQGYGYSDWFRLVLSHPIKYLLVMFVSLFNIIFIEGIYSSVIHLSPFWAWIGFIAAKIILSLYLWLSFFKVGRKKPLLLSPIIYFVLIVTNFPVEPRYFYPLIPYLYFIVGLV